MYDKIHYKEKKRKKKKKKKEKTSFNLDERTLIGVF